MDIYLSKPVNKTASLVTNQSGCSDNFINNTKEEKKILGRRKDNISRSINELKKEMGLRCAVYNGKLPRFVLRHPRYKELLMLINEVNEINKELIKIKDKHANQALDYQRFFFTILKSTFPKEYEIVKDMAMRKVMESQE